MSIGSIVLRTKNYVDHVMVVDDGSRDHTSQIAELADAEVIRHQRNNGKGSALKTGFEAVGDSDIIVTLDADGQHDPAEIPKLVAPIIAGEADMVNGSRYLGKGDKNTPKYRRIGQNVLDKATNISSRLTITDTQSGFRAFAVHTIPSFRFKTKGYGIESEMLVDAANAGLKVKEVETGVRYDVKSSKKHPISHGIQVLVNVLQDMELNRPLYYFTLPGLILACIGTGMGLIFLRDYMTGISITLAPTILMIILALAGAFMMFTGIILDSISRLIERTMNK
ncbi:MAG: glycosyltransferase family 2 protein [Euryarchaeota archaeon]|nr:glycosyltransferase family 2 protein [Euryarchaeota archaeon]